MSSPSATRVIARQHGSLLDAKLSIPRLGDTLVRRSRAIEVLDTAIEVPLTVVTAPAGYGKTTAVAQWATMSDHPVSWISLGDEDNNPSTFFRYLVTSILDADPDDLQEILDRLAGPHDLQNVMELVVSSMGLATHHFFVVFDDFHCLTNSDLLRAFAFLINRLPSQAHIILIGRSMPDLRLARLRANQALREIEITHLAFSEEESLTFRSAVGLDAIEENLWASVARRTEGWVAGMQLARLSLRDMDPAVVAGFVDAFDGRLQTIDEYLLEEVLDALPAELRYFVIRSSLLPALNPALCDYVFETDRSTLLLQELQRRSLFVVSLGPEQDWLRYHHLFTDALQHRAACEVNAGEIDSIHARAAEWLGNHGHEELAIRHAISCQRWDLAIALVHRICEPLALSDRVTSMRYWLDLLPRDVVMADPDLRYLLLWSLALSVSFDQDGEEIALIDTEDPDPAFPARSHLVRMQTSYVLGDVNGMYKHGRALQGLLDNEPDELLIPRMYGQVVVATARYFVGEFAEAESILAEFRALADSAPQPWMPIRGEARFADSLCLQGLLDDAATLLDKLEASSSMGLHPGDAQVYWFLASICLERNDLDRADSRLDAGLQIVDATSGDHWLPPLHITRAMVAWARGDVESAHEHAERARIAAKALGNPNYVQRADALQAMMWIARGQHILAERWLATANPKLSWVREFNQPYPALAVVRLLAARGETERAFARLDEIIDATRRYRRVGDLVRLHAMKAALLVANDGAERAVQELSTAIDLGAPGGFLRSFLDEGPILASLFNHPTIRTHTHRNYAQSIKQSFESQTVGLTHGTRGMVEALSLRELEVLRLVSGGQSNRDISRELYISEPTVKKHMSNILGKLEVLNRTQAVSVAREMGLI